MTCLPSKPPAGMYPESADLSTGTGMGSFQEHVSLLVAQTTSAQSSFHHLLEKSDQD